ncbi:MAG: TolC family protein [Desulfobacterales bacterium]|nr:TolC family protein [Desulfobacterales bacterium]
MTRIGDFTDHLYIWCFYAGLALLLTAGSPPANAAEDVSLTLSIKDFVRRVKEKNEYIRSQNLEWAISLEAVKNSEAIFEPEFFASYDYNDETDFQRTAFSRGTVQERTGAYALGIAGLSPLGTRIQLGHTLEDLTNDFDLEDNHEYRGFLGISLVQPILKNWGVETTRANIEISKENAAISFQDYRKKTMEIVGSGIISFWDLYRSMEVIKILRESVNVTEQLLKDTKARVRAGKLAETMIYEAMAGVNNRKALLFEARQQLAANRANLKNYISYTGHYDNEAVMIDAAPDTKIPELDFDLMMENARKNRPEYISARIKKGREEIRVSYAKNQTLPDLDLKASYGYASYDGAGKDSLERTLDDEYTVWSLGFEFRIPIFGGEKTKSELAAAQHRQAQADLELNAVEVALNNDLKSVIKNVIHINEQVQSNTEAAHYYQIILETEIARMKAGKSNSRIVLQKEEDYIEAKEARLTSQVNYQKALMGLRMIDGTLLAVYNIEEDDDKK